MENTSAPNIGVVTKGPSRGKVVAEWHIAADPRSFKKVPGGQAPEGDAVVKVFMTGLTLRAESAFLSKPIEHTDLTQLHELVQDEVRRHLALRTGLDWQRYLCVEVRESSKAYRDSNTRGTEIGYRTLWYAKGPDGKQFTLHSSNNVVVELEPELAPGDGKALAEAALRETKLRLSNDHTVVSRFYVPDTEQNLAAIHRIQQRFDELTMALGELLRPTQAQAVLSTIKESDGASPQLLGWLPRA